MRTGCCCVWLFDSRFPVFHVNSPLSRPETPVNTDKSAVAKFVAGPIPVKAPGTSKFGPTKNGIVGRTHSARHSDAKLSHYRQILLVGDLFPANYNVTIWVTLITCDANHSG